MAYRIEYRDGTVSKIIVAQEGKKNKRIIRVLAIICALMLIYSANKFPISDALIPGDPQVTKVAASKFATEIQQGNSIADAFEIFCREVICGANIPDVY